MMNTDTWLRYIAVLLCGVCLCLVGIGNHILSNYSIPSYELQYSIILYPPLKQRRPKISAAVVVLLLINLDIHVNCCPCCIRSLILKLNIHGNLVRSITSIGNCIFQL